MELSVGTGLALKGKQWIVVRITTFDETRLASESSKTYLYRGNNSIGLADQIEDFEAGDIIDHSGETVELRAADGSDTLFLHTKCHVRKKEKEDGTRRSQENDIQTPKVSDEKPG